MNSSFTPLVSIITPVYNGADFLDALIQSVQVQKYPNIEHIIIDDGSTDNGATLEVLEKYPHLRWWTRLNKGQYATMNEGLLAAIGEIICFISADDIMAPNAISIVVSVFENHSEFDCVYGNYGFMNSEGIKLNLIQPMSKMPTNMYPYSLHISHSSFYIRKKALIQNELFFNNELKYIGDYFWIVQILKSQLVIGKINNNLSIVRIHDQQTSTTNFYKMREEMFFLQKNLKISLIVASFFRKLWFFINFFNSIKINGVKRSFKTLRHRFQKRPNGYY